MDGAFGEWDELDFLAAGGILVAAGSLVALLFPRFRRMGLLFPIAIGAAMMAAAAYGARYSNGVAIDDEGAQSDGPWLATSEAR
jgi:hypothetical protein